MSGRMFGAALAGSLLVHVGLAGVAPERPAPQLDGGDVAGEVALGLGFADLVAQTQAAVRAPPPARTAPAQPRAVAAPPGQVPLGALAEVSETLQATTPLAAAAPLKSRRATAPEVAPAPTPKPVTQPERLPAQPVEPVPEPTPKPAPKADPQTPRAETAQTGNAKTNQRKGQESGQASGKQAETTAKATKSTAKTAGSGAVKSYQRSVLRQIARVPKKSAGAKGKALVGVTIAGSGAIGEARIVRSSGHAAIDSIALAHVRRAGPFKPTPTGQAIRVVVQFDSKK